MKHTQLTEYEIPCPRFSGKKLAVVADVHGKANKDLLGLLQTQKPDLILVPGDLTDDRGLEKLDSPAYTLLEECAKIAPTFYSLGNHEIGCYHKGNPWRKVIPKQLSESVLRRIGQTGVKLLQNEFVFLEGMWICGLTSGLNGKKNKPDTETLQKFDRCEGYKLLLCHHPEYYVPYIKTTSIDLTVCGHAHGGQWRVFGHGVYAPGQGLFPKYTSGVLDGRCVISRGLGNHTTVPRIFNQTELVLIHLT